MKLYRIGWYNPQSKQIHYYTSSEQIENTAVCVNDVLTNGGSIVRKASNGALINVASFDRADITRRQRAKNSMNMFGPKRVVYVQGIDGEPLTDRDFFSNEEAR